MSAVAFEYEAVDRAGTRRSGVTTAPTEQEAFRRVASTGVTPIRLRRARKGAAEGRGSPATLIARRRTISLKDVAQFTHQFATLLEARIPISEGLRSIGEGEPNPRMRAVVLEIASRIQAGDSVTEAISPHRREFGDVYVQTVWAAERSGNMIKVLGHLGEMTDRQIETRQQVRQALLYPTLVLTALGSATLFLIAFVVPRFAAMFEQRGVEMPLLTRMLESLGWSLQHWWWAYAGCAACAALAARAAWRRPAGRERIDRFLHRLPYLRRALVGLAVARFARVFGICLSSGLGLLESLEMSGRASGRPLLMKDAEQMMDTVRQGGRLGEALRTCRYVPTFAKRMISAGEESAELGRMCGVVSRHFEREVGHLTKNAATVIEPVLIAMLTGVVLIVALAVFLPMWDMMSLMK